MRWSSQRSGRGTQKQNRSAVGLAYAKAQYAEVDVPFLVSRIEVERRRSRQLGFSVRACSTGRIGGHPRLGEKSHGGKELARLKAHLGVMGLHLEDDQIAADMARIDDRPDPVQRTIFIDELPAWHGNVARLATYCQSRSDAALRSGLCLAVGGIPSGQLTAAERNAWRLVLTQWYETASDGGMHTRLAGHCANGVSSPPHCRQQASRARDASGSSIRWA